MKPTDPDSESPGRKIDTWSRTIISLALGILLGTLDWTRWSAIYLPCSLPLPS